LGEGFDKRCVGFLRVNYPELRERMLAGDPFQIFAIIGWILLISAVLTVFAFVNLIRATRSSSL
jgi:hypothetical protein